MQSTIFKLEENGVKSSKKEEKKNTVEKGEIAHYQQFPLFPQCFQKTYTADRKKQGLVPERVKQPILYKHELGKFHQTRVRQPMGI